MDWAQILVIILSVFLAIFLIIGIILGLMIVRLTRQIRMIATTAERAVVSVERVVKGVRLAAVPSLALRKIMHYMKKEKHHGSK